MMIFALAQAAEVVVAGRHADHAGGVAIARRPHRITEGKDHSGGIGPGLALQAQLQGHLVQRRLQAGARGAIGVQVFGQLDHEGDAGGVGFLGERT